MPGSEPHTFPNHGQDPHRALLAESVRLFAGLEDSELLVIQRRDFLHYLEHHPRVSISLLNMLCERLRLMDGQMEDLHFLDIRGHMSKTLSRLALQHGRTMGNGSIRIDLSLSQEDLGNLICATRESVNKHLKVWEDEGVLNVLQKSFVIHRLAVLEGVSGNG